MTAESAYVLHKFRMCIRHAREFRRDARKEPSLSHRDRRELRRMAVEAMQDARYWRELGRGLNHAQAEAVAYT